MDLLPLCTNESFPFEFYNVNGSVINGRLNEDGLCIFPEANCGPDNSITECCQAKSDSYQIGTKYMFIAFAFIMIPYMYLMCHGGKRNDNESDGGGGGGGVDNVGANQDEQVAVSSELEQEEQEREEEEEEEENQPDHQKHHQHREDRKQNRSVPSWVPDGILAGIFGLGLYFAITVQIMIPIFMRQSIQAKLDASSRNAIIASEAFLLPYNEIFQFIEDIVLVRVNYALGAGNKSLTDQLVHIGIVGSFLTGVLAAVIGVVLGVVSPVLEALTQPGADHDADLYPGCDLIGVETEKVLPYWLGEVWAIPGTQVGLVLSGFMLGAMELPTVGWMQAISISMIPIIWFSTVDQAPNKILMLALAEFTSKWMFPVMAIAYLVSPLGRDLRENTGFELRISKLWKSFGVFFCKPRSTEEEQILNGNSVTVDNNETPTRLGAVKKDEAASSSASPPQEDTKTLLLDGLKIMVMDVAIQVCNSVSIYLALLNSGADGYKITSLQSALPTYGIAYAFGMGIMFKIVGPQLIAHKAFAMFATYARITLVCAFLLIPLIVGAVVPFRSGLAYEYGGNACQYAKNDECLPFFTHVLGENAQGGDYTLEFTFSVFALGASIEALFCVLRSALLALVDLDFMLWGTSVAVAVYVPCVAVAATVPPFGGHAIAFFVTMFIPETVLCTLFFFRVIKLIHRVEQGKDGTWTSKSQRKLVVDLDASVKE